MFLPFHDIFILFTALMQLFLLTVLFPVLSVFHLTLTSQLLRSIVIDLIFHEKLLHVTSHQVERGGRAVRAPASVYVVQTFGYHHKTHLYGQRRNNLE
jgi:hypothetical protein